MVMSSGTIQVYPVQPTQLNAYPEGQLLILYKGPQKPAAALSDPYFKAKTFWVSERLEKLLSVNQSGK